MTRKFIIDPIAQNEEHHLLTKFKSIDEIYNIEEDSNWIDKGTYYLNVNEQRTPGWFRARLFRVTTSEFGTPLQLNEYCTDNEYAEYITCIRKRIFLVSEINRMNHGCVNETLARLTFCSLKSMKTKIYRVEEIGLAVPKSNLRVGGSTDGVVYINGKKTARNIEIKCPVRMYKELEENLVLIDLNCSQVRFLSQSQTGYSRTKISKEYYENIESDKFIKPMHYSQMQGCINILNAKSCYYIVYETTRQLMCVTLVKRNDDYINYMMSGIDKFINTKVVPLIEKNWIEKSE